MKKISSLILLSLLIMVPVSLSAQQASPIKTVQGSWLGKLSAGGMDLRIIFNLKLTAKDSLVATLDSPDQGAKDYPCGKVTLDQKKLTISAPNINGEYVGTITGDSTITGTWSQNGGSFPLDLKKQKPIKK